MITPVVVGLEHDWRVSETKIGKVMVTMKRLWKVVSGAAALIAVGMVLAPGPVAARVYDGPAVGGAALDDGSNANSAGGALLEPPFQAGNAQGDGRGQ